MNMQGTLMRDCSDSHVVQTCDNQLDQGRRSMYQSSDVVDLRRSTKYETIM